MKIIPIFGTVSTHFFFLTPSGLEHIVTTSYTPLTGIFPWVSIESLKRSGSAI
jgi:hypothetical protein